ncbi:MAG: beta-N-acetylhexosaminidase [Gammaproteobacteria bacterium]|nr:MAG: beta-N-acetylhexosaminidase [Gammaproteobacteria bacterium]
MIADTALYLFGVQGKNLNETEVAWLKHPLTAGVVLFTRNYENPEQIKAFIKTIRQTAKNALLIAVDHEGGRVQRFRQGFTAIPAMAELGKIYDRDKNTGLALTKAAGYVMAYEIAQCDIDFSFAPVLDVQTDFSPVIGDRAFHSDVRQIGPIATAFYRGMQEAGMAGVGKHFPGHGNVAVDSHRQLPVNAADFADLEKTDLPPFNTLIKEGIEAIMPAHILYPQVDQLPAGFSPLWLKTILRERLGFKGCIISDDLDMAGAAAYGNMAERVKLAKNNCDLILLCNCHADMKMAFASQVPEPNPRRQARQNKLRRRKGCLNQNLYQQALCRLRQAKLIG